jgi:hypothetical protein
MSTKRDSVSLTSPLDNAGILSHVLNILGPGQHLFISAVSKTWRDSYKKVASVPMAGWQTRWSKPMITVTADATLLSAVLASTSRFKLAHECGLNFDNAKVQHIAGKTADLSVLQAAHELGLELTEEVVSGAAAAASVPKLQWLHTEQGCPLHDGITYYAAKSGNVDVLIWLKDRGQELKADTCMGAAAGAHVHLLQYLRDEGCEWNVYICGAAASNGHLTTLQWLHDQGCPWLRHRICADAAESGSIAVAP